MLDAERWLRAVRATTRIGVGPQEIPDGWTLLGGGILNDRMCVYMSPLDALQDLGPETLQYVVRSVEQQAELWIVGEAQGVVSRGGKLFGGYVFTRKLRRDGVSFNGQELEGSKVTAIVERSREKFEGRREIVVENLDLALGRVVGLQAG